jgi:hypothetical protein
MYEDSNIMEIYFSFTFSSRLFGGWLFSPQWLKHPGSFHLVVLPSRQGLTGRRRKRVQSSHAHFLKVLAQKFYIFLLTFHWQRLYTWLHLGSREVRHLDPTWGPASQKQLVPPGDWHSGGHACKEESLMHTHQSVLVIWGIRVEKMQRLIFTWNK